MAPESPASKGDSMGMADIAYGWLAYWFSGMEEALGVEMLNPGTLPRLHAWIQDIKQVPVIKEKIPDYEKMLAYMRGSMAKFIANLPSQ